MIRIIQLRMVLFGTIFHVPARLIYEQVIPALVEAAAPVYICTD